MKKDAYVAFIAVVFLTVVNFFGGLLNDAYGYLLGIDQVFEAIWLHLIFGILFWLTCLPKIKLRKTLRYPILRTLFWILIAWIMWFGDPDGQMASSDLMCAAIPPFCFFEETIWRFTYQIDWLKDIHFQVIGIYIVGITLYEILILELASKVVDTMTFWRAKNEETSTIYSSKA